MAQKNNQSPVPSFEQNTSPRPCSNGCGFFGVPNTNGMCSVCYKEHQSRLKNGRVSPLSAMGGGGGSVSTAEAVVNKVIGETATLSQQMTEMSLVCEDKTQLVEPSASVENKDSAAVAQATASTVQPASFTVSSNCDDSKDPGPTKPKTNRCFMCRKKVGLTGFDCRCGNQFCGLHRYSDKHNCPYDYKAEAAAKIRKENPAVVADKIQRI